ncbi:WD40-repeat-containing domain protein [Zopfochytrium polystomum]|nr:WD40-repeat-containing domain protein [Zopfochytrium polystomum]
MAPLASIQPTAPTSVAAHAVSELAVAVPVAAPAAVAHITVWDVRSGAVVGAFKGVNGVPSRAFDVAVTSPAAGARLSSISTSLLLASQPDKPIVHVWSWQKEQEMAKFTLPEKLTSLTVSNNGQYAVGGGESGRVFIWEMSSGNMLRMFDAHFKPVRAIRFTSDDEVFATCGGDATAHLWMTGRVVAPAEDERSPTAYHSLTGHTLPVTDARFSTGVSASSNLFTSSLDRTIRIWDTQTGSFLAKVVFPSSLLCVQPDPLGLHLYAGGQDGNIYIANMYKEGRDGQPLKLSTGDAVTSEPADGRILKGHLGPVTGLALSLTGRLVVSSSEDGTSITWDAVSRQIIRVHAPKLGPLADVKIILRPAFLLEPPTAEAPQPSVPVWKRFELNHSGSSVAQSSGNQVVVLPVHKQSAFESRNDHWQTEVFAEAMADVGTAIPFYDQATSMARRLDRLKAELTSQEVIEIAKLSRELELLRDHNQALRTANDELYQAAVRAATNEARSKSKTS